MHLYGQYDYGATFCFAGWQEPLFCFMKYLKMTGKSNATREKGWNCSKTSVAVSSILSSSCCKREKRGFTLSRTECSSYYPRLLLDMLNIASAFKRIMIALKLHLPLFSMHEVIYTIMPFSV